MQKVFGIGLNKTGTTTLQHALQMLGYAVTGPNKALMPDVMGGHYERALALTDEYDAFQDWPWPYMFEPAFNRYGRNARYILTVRESPEAWLRSLKNHVLQDRIGKIFRPRFVPYGTRYPFGFEREYLDFYDCHIYRVRKFFEVKGAQDCLLEVCWERGDGWEKLCAFLDHPVMNVPFPHSNATTERKWNRTRQKFNGLVAHMLARLNGRKITERILSGPLN